MKKVCFLILFTATTVMSQSPAMQADTSMAVGFTKKAKDLQQKSSQYDSSNFYYDKARAIYEKIVQIDNSTVMTEKYVDCLYNIGANYYKMAQYGQAMEFLNAALETGLPKLGNNHFRIANVYEFMGSVYRQQQMFDKALEYYQSAYNIYSKLDKRVGNCYLNYGILYHQKGDYDLALENYQKALNIFRQKYGEIHFDIASVSNNMASIYQAKSEYDRAFESFNRALSIYLQIVGENHSNTANCYFNLGNLFEQKGDLEMSLEYYQKSLNIDLKNLGPDHPSVAFTYNSIGINYGLKGDYDRSLEYARKALAIINKDETRKNIRVLYFIYESMGNAYYKKGELEKALEAYNKAIQFQNANHPFMASCYVNIASVHQDTGQYDQALEYWEKSLRILIDSFGEKHRMTAYTYNGMATLFKLTKQDDKALTYYNKALTIMTELFGEKGYGTAEILNNLGTFYFSRRDYANALQIAQRAIVSSVRDFSEHDVEKNPPLESVIAEVQLFHALELKADILKQKYTHLSHDPQDLLLAYDTYEKTVQLCGLLANSYQQESSKLFLGQKAAGIYDKAIQTALTLYDLKNDTVYREKAFVFAEKAKAGVLLAALMDSKARSFAGLPDSLVRQEKQLRTDLACFQTHLQNELEKKADRDSTKITMFRERLFGLNRDYQNLIQKLEREYPAYYDLKYQNFVPAVADIQNNLDPYTVLLDYFVGDSLLSIFIISRDMFDVCSLPIDYTLIRNIRSCVHSVKKVDAQGFLISSFYLYSKLVQPVEKKFKPFKKLVVIPHSDLHRVPFEALTSTKPESDKFFDFDEYDYLLNRYEISYHYSVTLYLRNKLQDKFAHAKKTFVGFAPVFSDKDENGYIVASHQPVFDMAYAEAGMRSISLDGKHLNELKYSEQEIQNIIRLYENKNQTAIGFFHTEATEENFRNVSGGYDIVHIATHGIIHEDNPHLSGIVFSQPPDTSRIEDGILYAGEAYNLDLDADLLVLSACESGMGKLVKGEGLMALTRGFLSSGVSNLIVSLWKVDDQYSSLFMTEFFQHVLEGKSYAEALRMAKLNFVRNPALAFPKIWSAFVLVGG